MAEVGHVIEMSTPTMQGPNPTVESIAERMHDYESASATLVSLLGGLALFADAPEHDRLAVEALQRIVGTKRELGGFTVYVELQMYPATLAMYTLGLGAIAGGRLEPFAQACRAVKVADGGDPQPLYVAAAPWRVLDSGACNALIATDGQNRKTPVSDYLNGLLGEQLRVILAVGADFDDLFDEFEYLVGVLLTETYGRAPIGRFAWRRHHAIPKRLGQTLDDHADALVAAGLFGGDPELLSEARQTYDAEISKSGLSW